MSVLCVCPHVKNKPQHTAQEPQTHQKFQSLKIINSRDDQIRFEFDYLIPKGTISFEFISAGMVSESAQRKRVLVVTGNVLLRGNKCHSPDRWRTRVRASLATVKKKACRTCYVEESR